MDGLPELQPVHEMEEVIKNTQEWHGLEIEMPESESESEEDNSVFEAPKVETKPDSKQKAIEPIVQSVEPIEQVVERRSKQKPVIKIEANDKHLEWLLDVFEKADKEDHVFNDDIRQLLSDYEIRYGKTALITVNRFLKKYLGGTLDKIKRIRCVMGVRVKQILPPLEPISKRPKYVRQTQPQPEPEPEAKPTRKRKSEHTHSTTMDFTTFKQYFDAYNQEKEYEKNKSELERLRREKEEKALEAKFYEKFKHEQEIQQKHQMPDTFSHIDWSNYRGL